MTKTEMYRMSRKYVLAEIDLLQFLRGKRTSAGRFASRHYSYTVRSYVKDRKGAAKRLMKKIPNDIRICRAILK